MAGLKVSIWVWKSAKIGVFRPSNFLGVRMNTHIGDKIFQNTSRRVANFRENRPRGIEKSVVGKKEKTRPKYNSHPLSMERYAGDCKKIQSNSQGRTVICIRESAVAVTPRPGGEAHALNVRCKPPVTAD